jgi:hypothetical protein
LALFAVAFMAFLPGPAQAATTNVSSPGEGSQTTTVQPPNIVFNPSLVVIQGYVSEAPDIRDRPGVLIPVAGARIYFIANNTVLGYTASNPVGFYSVALPPRDDYTVAVTAPGFQTLIRCDVPLTCTQSFDIGLTPVPFNGFVPYALYPVLETSPGREVDCVIVVENFQVIDQMVTFTAVTPPEWQAWFPLGESMMIRTGDANEMIFVLKYVGKKQGPHVMKVVVNGGAYFAEIPVIVVVKDLPFEEITFWSYSPGKIVKPGATAEFFINAENKYAQDKDLDLRIEKPDNWSVTTGNGTEFFIPDAKTGSSRLWVYVPSDTPPGDYAINLTLCGEGVKSNELVLTVRVEDEPLYDAIIKGQNRTAEGYPELNVSAGQPFALPVRVYNSWDFPLTVQASAEIGDNWPYYFEGVPGGRIKLEPNRSLEFRVRSAVPNDTYGNFTARVYLESPGQDMTLLALITVPPPPPPPPEPKHDWEGPALTGATVAAIALSLLVSMLKRGRP